jgi:hypothetical protein
MEQLKIDTNDLP